MTNKTDSSDIRWGGYIPWFLRHEDIPGSGNFLLFFNRLSHRVYQLLYHDEVGIKNMPHFGSMLESKSLQRYRYTYKSEYGSYSLACGVRDYFDTDTIENEMKSAIYNDPVEVELHESFRKIKLSSYGGFRGGLEGDSKKLQQEYQRMEIKAKSSRNTREEVYYRPLFIQRLGVLEILLRILPHNSEWFIDFVSDIRKYLAESGVMLDINISNYNIELLEEPLLQKEVIDNLLPRLRSRFPERADELIKTYHDTLRGENFDDIFIGAFKTLEEIGRSLTGDKNFEFSNASLKKYYSGLHETIHLTIIKLNAHRGDKGGHGRSTPAPYEMRYLLFSIYNIALLMLDYKDAT
jgi:hypothetical protein